jgi:hypothetical protein
MMSWTQMPPDVSAYIALAVDVSVISCLGKQLNSTTAVLRMPIWDGM